MALQHKREAAIRPRFLVALILSTVTAVGVAAPLAMSGFGDDSGTIMTFEPGANGISDGVPVADPGAELNNILRQRTLENGTPAVGGIGARARTKAQDQTHKAGETQPVEPSTTVTSLLTNATTVPDPTTVAPETTAPTTAEPTSTTPATTIPPSETTDTQRPPSTAPTTDPGAGTPTTTRPSTTPAPDASNTEGQNGNG